MFTLPRLTARLAVVASFAALLAAACNTDSTGPSSPTKSTLSAHHTLGLTLPTGAAGSFAVLGNAAVSCTDGTIIGSVGTFQALPTGAVTLVRCPVTGTVHVGDGAAIAAYNAFQALHTSLAPAPCTQVLTGTLAGVTLTPGTYCFDAAATLTGVLTLNGAGGYLFKIGNVATGALTGTNFTVALLNGATACSVTWWTSAAATMTTSAFNGSILSGAAITTTGGTFHGNAWATAGATITGTAVTSCASSGGKGNDDGDDEEDDGDNGHGDRDHDKDKGHDRGGHDGHENHGDERDS
jgi:hypothetical protein